MRNKNRIEALVDKLQDEGAVDRLEGELQKFNPNKLNEREKESWHHFYGIAAFQKGDREGALKRFSEGRAACPESGMIAFSLGQEYQHAGQIEKMLENFDAFKFPTIPASYALFQGRYAYLWNKIDKAIEYVSPILDAYYDLKIADDNFLYMRDLPFYGETWSTLGTFYLLKGDLKTLKSITRESASKLSDYDFEEHFKFIESIETKNFQTQISTSEELIDEYSKQNCAAGTFQTKIAIIKSKLSNNLEEALNSLQSVELREEDFPWLKDMLLLAQCEVAQRFSSPTLTQMIEDFFSNQPLLFEPNHIFDYQMVEFQERLKTQYQKRRTI